jgi:hypothetical protein
MYPTTSWRRQDLFFLANSLRSGRSLAEVAGFLLRSEDEVREKAEELGITKVKGRARPPLRSPRQSRSVFTTWAIRPEAARQR